LSPTERDDYLKRHIGAKTLRALGLRLASAQANFVCGIVLPRLSRANTLVFAPVIQPGGKRSGSAGTQNFAPPQGN
jgi:hypothetical protein